MSQPELLVGLVHPLVTRESGIKTMLKAYLCQEKLPGNPGSTHSVLRSHEVALLAFYNGVFYSLSWQQDVTVEHLLVLASVFPFYV